ncbi:MAG: SDR family oxidoreductase [Burkholderiales bacterium]|nr:SDR family oxidoreductase [Burkholderiales bacterium]
MSQLEAVVAGGSMNAELKGKVAVVTGATRRRGLGRAIALRLARAGADVVVTGSGAGKAAADLPRDERAGWRGLEDVVNEIRGLGVRALGLSADVSQSAEAGRLIDETVRVMGRLDILVNNAAYPRGADRVPLTELDEATWRRIVDVNLTGTMLCCRQAARRMIAQGEGGSIISISSGAAVKAPPTFSAYAASKAGVHALNAVLAAELGQYGITANVVAPGFIDTARIDMLREDGRWQQRLSTIPIRRAGTVAEIAELVGYLCGPHARWISGEVFLINGGEVRRAAN